MKGLFTPFAKLDALVKQREKQEENHAKYIDLVKRSDLDRPSKVQFLVNKGLAEKHNERRMEQRKLMWNNGENTFLMRCTLLTSSTLR